MKSTNEIKAELLKVGAITRLEELNKERNILLKILGKTEPTKTKDIIKSARKYKRNRKHWTQKLENQAKLRRILKLAGKKRLEMMKEK